MKINAEMMDGIDSFYNIYSEFYKRCGERNLAIQLTCGIIGIKIQESNTLSFFLGKETKKWESQEKKSTMNAHIVERFLSVNYSVRDTELDRNGQT